MSVTKLLQQIIHVEYREPNPKHVPRYYLSACNVLPK